MTDRLKALAGELYGNEDLAAAIARQDAAVSSRIVARALYGA
jgi:hypothetical protein